MNLKKSSYVFSCVIGIILCLTAACSSSARIVIKNNADYDLSAEFIPSALLEKNLTRLMQHETSQSVFNREVLTQSLTEAGLTVKKITVKGTLGLNVNCTLPHTHELINGFIRYDQKQKTTVLTISPENIRSFLSMIPQESREFIDMLMAPLFTGDAVTPADYEELIGVAYGKKVAAELRNSEFLLTVEVPYQAQTARIKPLGTVTVQTGAVSRAVIRLPLIDLLCTTGTIEVQL